MTSIIAEMSPDVPAPSAATRLVYDGRSMELLRLWIEILCFSALTFGIYRFWGRTRIRKYLWNHTILMGDRLEYDGTGGELFRRFLVAGVVLILIVLPGYIAEISGTKFWVLSVLQVLQTPVFIFLFFMAIYAGRRYRFSRTLWRGIRGGLDGSIGGYAARAFGYFWLGALTLTLITPWQLVGLWRYEINNTGFGDWQFRFEGSGKKLFPSYLAVVGFAVLGVIVAVAIPAATGLYSTIAARSAGGPPIGKYDAKLIVSIIVAVMLAIGVFLAAIAIGSIFFYTKVVRYLAANTGFGSVAFSAEIRKRDLFWLLLGNLLLLVFTLGLASPFVSQRLVRFFCRYLRIYHSEDLLNLTQAAGRREKAGGEGLAQLLDSGGFA
jgi:uncharacterized membrane protein YjgN (DUF898 family)